MIARFSVLFAAVAITGAAHAQTPLGQGPATPGSAATTPTQRVAAANSVVNSTLPVGSVPQAQAQAAGNFGPLARPESIGGQIQEAWSRPGKKQGIHVQNFCGDCVYKVRLRQYMVSAIQLPKGVKIKSADMGDSSRFEVKKRSDNTLAVKPTGAGVDSSMLVYTDDATSGISCGRVMVRFQAQVVPRDVGARSDAFDTSNVFTSFQHEEPDVV